MAKTPEEKVPHTEEEAKDVKLEVGGDGQQETSITKTIAVLEPAEVKSRRQHNRLAARKFVLTDYAGQH